MAKMKHILLVPVLIVFVACNPFARIDRLVPPVGDVGDVIDIRDPVHRSLRREGTVYFGVLEAPNVLSWTPEDVFVEVPPGLTGTVPVTVVINEREGNVRDFLVLEDVELTRIMCFGDSIIHMGVPEVLQDSIDQDPDLSTLDLVALNQGRTAELLTGNNTRTRWVNALDYSDLDLVILLEGANDLTDSSYKLMMVIQQHLMTLLDDAMLAGVDVVLCTLLPRVGPCGDEASPTTEGFNEWLRSFADEMDIPLIDVHEDFLSTEAWEQVYFGADCLHPNANGIQRIAELIEDKIKEIYLPTF